MKKNTSKSAAESSAKATKVAPVKVKVAVAARKAVPVLKPAKLVAKKKPAARAAAPAVKVVAAKAVVATITAQIDIGFGNALYVRGEGAGLSWDHGLLMNCVSNREWQCVLGESARPIVFKFLVNDLSWSTGEDFSVTAGTNATLTPTF
ncbi:MAG: hypothetical protein CK548_00365 [Opitutia bacterium]|nr:hypothetical protein [Opitutaceae bacterium]PHX73550.1 MAG: hypothetical protein CK548_00365 [Opitutae bacterium]